MRLSRKNFIGLTAAGSVAAWPGGAFAVSDTVGGRVLAAGKGMAGVVVTDGLTCVETAADGSWSLPVREGKANPTPAIVRNCLFAFNETTDATGDTSGGGLMFATYSDVTLENCTIVSNNIRNTAGYKSGGIHHRYSGGKLKNCIVAFNTVCGQPEDAEYWNNHNTVSTANYINCCVSRENSKLTADNGCITADPKFTDPANGDFTLRPDSPCVNKGLDADWMTSTAINPATGKRVKVFDLAGSPRLSGEHVDIGCYELYIPKGPTLSVR